ncbi:iron ABC transporter permease [Actinomadura soli]|uniref:Iron ABC transporter permease n=1 Tax=Actinomadura soli TaxID=2508997 RepID=A0A5C4JK45_9ACTN|nr:iron ABC transporter permease [Actinomadura soli]TMR06854.1 iron ABC transporter permease [Actinomadura soli]
MTATATAADSTGSTWGARRPLLLLAGLVALATVMVASVGVGAHFIGPATALHALSGSGDPNDVALVRDIRLPRGALAIGVGAALAVSGVLVQVLSRNPLGEPGVLGVTSGAGFAISVGSGLGLTVNALGELLAAVVGAVAAAALVAAVGRRSPLRMLLAGMALSSVLTGLTLGMRLISPTVFDKYRFWSIGSLAGREQAPNTMPLLVIAVAVAAALLLSRQLAAVALGEAVAHTLGVNVTRVRLVTLVLITALAGAATAIAGPILFVGLIVPHLVRRAADGSVPWLIGFAAVLGPVLLLAADTAARVLLTTGEVPVAIVTAFLGGPALIWAVRRYGVAQP